MFGTFLKKKINENQVANIFINGLFDSIDKGFELVSQVINEDQGFIESPSIDANNINEFALIVLAGNITEIERQFEGAQSDKVLKLVYEKLAKVYGMSEIDMRNLIKEYRSFMNRINMPSKNTVYAMSKAIFFKYELNAFQDEYFRRMQVPNPLFLKRIDEMISHFLWNWDAFFKKYRF